MNTPTNCPRCGFDLTTATETTERLPGVIETRDAGGAIEWRSFDVKEIRVVREEGKPPRITGYAATFNQPSLPLTVKTDKGPKQFVETIAPGAFTRALADGRDLVALVGHQPNQPIARASAGKMKVTQDDKGLAFDLTPPDTTRARDLMADIDHGNIRGMSFGFGDATDAWDKRADGMPLRTLKDIDLKEISFTPFPAYEGTSVDVRSIRDALEQLEQRDHPGDYSVVASHCRAMSQYCRDMADRMMSTRDALDAHTGDMTDAEQKHVRDLHDAMKEMNKRCTEVRDRTRAKLATSDDTDDAEEDDDADPADDVMRSLMERQRRAEVGLRSK